MTTASGGKIERFGGYHPLPPWLIENVIRLHHQPEMELAFWETTSMSWVGLIGVSLMFPLFIISPPLFGTNTSIESSTHTPTHRHKPHAHGQTSLPTCWPTYRSTYLLSFTSTNYLPFRWLRVLWDFWWLWGDILSAASSWLFSQSKHVCLTRTFVDTGTILSICPVTTAFTTPTSPFEPSRYTQSYDRW